MNATLAMMFCIFVTLSAAAVNVYHVDGIRGNEDWDGSVSYADRDEAAGKGPVKKLGTVFAKVTKTTSEDQDGDIVYVYEGDYYGEGSANVAGSIPDGCKLIGVGDKTKIVIHGSGTTWANRESEAAAASGVRRCLRLGNWVLVKGVTLRDGRASANGGAATVGAGCYFVGCDFVENYTTERGGALSSGNVTVIRCTFTDNDAKSTGDALMTTKAWNCVFSRTSATSADYICYQNTCYNCLFLGSGKSAKSAKLYNCISVLDDSGACVLNHCVVNGMGSGTTKDDASIIGSLALLPDYRQKTLPVVEGDKTVFDEYPASRLVADEKGLDFNGVTRIYGGQVDVGPAERAPRAWYVNPDTAVGNDANAGDCPEFPKKTLVGALTIASLASGDIVHAAAGDYRENAKKSLNTHSTWCRAVVPAGVGLVADGADATIYGSKSEDVGGGVFAPVRGVWLKDNASWIKGFTIRDGYTATQEDAGGAYGAGGSAAVDCRFINNGSSNYGSATRAVGCIRCYFEGNSTQGGTHTSYQGDFLFNCVYKGKDGYAGGGTIVNCYFEGNLRGAQPSHLSSVYNSYVAQDYGYKTYVHCRLGNAEADLKTGSSASDGTTFGEILSRQGFDERYRPTANSALRDAGVRSYYDDNFPTAWEQFKDLDFAGGQRVYNGKIDLAPGEYDYRPVFSKELAGRRAAVSVVSASADVSEADTKGIVLSGGDKVEFDWPIIVTGEHRFALSLLGDGEASVSVDGEPVTIAGNICSFMIPESSVGQSVRVAVSYVGSGTAQVSDLVGGRVGMAILFR